MLSCMTMMSLQLCNVFLLLPATSNQCRVVSDSIRPHARNLLSILICIRHALHPVSQLCFGRACIIGKCLSDIEPVTERLFCDFPFPFSGTKCEADQAWQAAASKSDHVTRNQSNSAPEWACKVKSRLIDGTLQHTVIPDHAVCNSLQGVDFDIVKLVTAANDIPLCESLDVHGCSRSHVIRSGADRSWTTHKHGLISVGIACCE